MVGNPRLTNAAAAAADGDGDDDDAKTTCESVSYLDAAIRHLSGFAYNIT